MNIDTVHICEQLLDGNGKVVINSGWHEVEVSNLGAAYEISQGKLRVLSSGCFHGETPMTIMVEAPEHYGIQANTFTGCLTVAGHRCNIQNNQIVAVI